MDDFRTLISNDRIEQRIRELATEVAANYGDVPPRVVSVIEGARMFTRRLLRSLAWPVVAHEIRASSYGEKTVSSGRVEVTGGHGLSVDGQRVLLVEDIVDTGRTIERLRRDFLAQGAVDVAVVTLLSKPSRREVEVELQFVGFEIPNEFVIGYGMDYAGRYRELDRVAIFDASKVVESH